MCEAGVMCVFCSGAEQLLQCGCQRFAYWYAVLHAQRLSVVSSVGNITICKHNGTRMQAKIG